MTKQVINTGSAANDGTGDTLRAAAQKINSNFTEVYDTSQASFNQANTAVNNAAGASLYANSAFNQANTGVNNAAGASLYANGAFIKSNTAFTHAQAAFNYANTIISDTQIDPVARTTANNASNNITEIQGVNVTQNTNITTVTNTSTAAFIQANTANVLAQAAFDKANTGADLGDLVITDGSISTGGVSDIYLAPNGEGYAWINLPSDASAANGAATVIGHGVDGGSGVRISSYNKTWYFNPDGSLRFPTLTVPISDNANPSGTGQTLKFSEPFQQAIIYGPPSNSEYNSAERIIIQGAPGYTETSGEGGDVYLWAGPGGSANGNGGDIKVRAGQGFGTGNGGYLNLQAGDTNGAYGGYINIESGAGPAGQGGDIDILARSGGDIDINSQGGAIGIHTTSSSWFYRADGYVSYPSNTLKYEGSILAISTTNDVPTAVTSIESTTGSWEANPMSDLETTGGNGTGLTVDVTETGGYASAIAINTAGSNYLDGDLITVTSGSSSATFIISVVPHTFTLGGGILVFPDESEQTGAAISITELKVLVAASTDFADFQTRIANL